VKKATSPYGNTKQIAEEILQETAAAYDNYNIIALRYFNPVGAHESALIGELQTVFLRTCFLLSHKQPLEKEKN
jgi:UDP-glucose 4-epimerase